MFTQFVCLFQKNSGGKDNVYFSPLNNGAQSFLGFPFTYLDYSKIVFQRPGQVILIRDRRPKMPLW